MINGCQSNRCLSMVLCNMHVRIFFVPDAMLATFSVMSFFAYVANIRLFCRWYWIVVFLQSDRVFDQPMMRMNHKRTREKPMKSQFEVDTLNLFALSPSVLGCWMFAFVIVSVLFTPISLDKLMIHLPHTRPRTHKSRSIYENFARFEFARVECVTQSHVKLQQ